MEEFYSSFKRRKINTKTSYFIKRGYIDNIPVDNTPDKDYIWDAKRIGRNLYANFNVYKYAHKIASTRNIKTILDIGCGPGVKLNHFFLEKGYQTTAIDNVQAIEYCKTNYKDGRFIDLDLADSRNFEKLIPQGFDLIICVDVIEHFENPDLLLEFIRMNASENSIIIISTPERDIVRGKRNLQSPNKDHVREWNMKEFRSYMENNGFSVLDHFLTAPIKFNLSYYYFINLLYYKLKLRRFKGTQIVTTKHSEEISG